MKREKTKKSVLKKQKVRASLPTTPAAEMGKALDTAQTGTMYPMPTESITTAVEDEPKRQDLEASQAEDAVPSSPQRSSDSSAEGAEDAGKILQLLAFLIGDEEYGIDIRMVKEIIRLTEITSVPRAPSYIQGIISLRGTVLPIFDLRQLLSMPDFKPDKKSRILVVSLEESPVGIIVDAVTEVMELKEAELEPPPTVMTNLEADHIKGMGRYKERLIILLDLEKVYRARLGQVKSVQGQDTPVSP